MCEFHGSNGNGFGDIWWTDKLFYFSSTVEPLFYDHPQNLDQSTQHFDIGTCKTTFRKHRSNIGSHIYIACLTATFVLIPIYPLRPVESVSCRPPSWWLSVLHSIYHSVVHNLKTFPCQITTTTNVMNHFCTRYTLFRVRLSTATYWSYVKRAALYLSDIHFAVVCQV